MEREKPIAVYRETGKLISYCTRRRAAQMVHREKARWIGRDELVIVMTDKEYKANAKRAVERDGHCCYICDRHLEDHEVTIDHKIPRSCPGGTDAEENLGCCCAACNRMKDNRTVEEFTEALIMWVIWQVTLVRRVGHSGRSGTEGASTFGTHVSDSGYHAGR